MIDENLIKTVAKKYDLIVKYEYNKPGIHSYTMMLDGKDICYYSTFRAGWAQVCTQVTVDWYVSDKPIIGFGDKHSMRNEKEFLKSIQYLVPTYNKLKVVVTQIQKEVKVETKLNDLEKDFKND
jgi:hypothetical protein